MAELRLGTATFGSGTALKLTFVGLGIFDLLLTLYALGAGYVELNPVVGALHDRLLALLLLKVAGPIAIAWAVPAKLLLPAIALLFAVVGWNVGELLVPA